MAPHQRTDGRWDFVQHMDAAIFPVGYCVGATRTEESFADCYHDGGHETAEDAARCYHRYCLDHYLILSEDPARPRELHECAVPDCLNFTAGYATCEGWRVFLCHAHRTRAVAESLMPVAMEIHAS